MLCLTKKQNNNTKGKNFTSRNAPNLWYMMNKGAPNALKYTIAIMIVLICKWKQIKQKPSDHYYELGRMDSSRKKDQ
jgi:hypothetical protein